MLHQSEWVHPRGSHSQSPNTDEKVTINGQRSKRNESV